MVSEDEVKKIARLARLTIEEGFVPVVTGHLNSILGYVEQLNAVDTSGVSAMSHVSEVTNVLRDDKVVPVQLENEDVPFGSSTVPQQGMLDEAALLKNAPDASGRFIRVPLIVE
jgi:aspartyl-tRNA(Asn)/glutamyl-tRNA(Gln) amidotransferase subunit C